MKKLHKYLVAFTAAAIAVASCSGSKGWSVKGTVENPTETKIALEGYNNGLWYVVDSLGLDSKGKFAYRADAPATPAQIYRLTCEGASIYFPADGTDAVTVQTDGSHFAQGYTLGGTPLAATICSVDSTVAAAVARLGAENAATDHDLRRALVEYITSDTTGTVAYYVVGKAIAGKQIFDPADAFGNRAYGAAAQVFAGHNPEDPRFQTLKNTYYAGRAALGKLPELPATTIEVDEKGYIDIENYDDRGTKHSISELVDGGKLVLLSFTAYGTEASVPYNAILNEIYTANKSKGLEIYQIAFDDDEQAWKTVARNLPWITVWNAPTDGASVLAQYNIGSLPITFIINRKGEIVERVADPTQLAAKVAKHI